MQLDFRHSVRTLYPNFKKSQKYSKKTITKVCFHVPYMPYFKWNVPFTKVLQKCSLTQVTMLHSLWNCKNCIKKGKTQKGVVWEAKHKPCMFGIITRSWLSNMWCVARLGTICTICKEFYHNITILPLYYQYCYYKILRLCITIILLLC